MTLLTQFAQSRNAFFRQHGYLPSTLIISAPNLQSLRAYDLLLIEGLRIARRQGSNIEFGHENKKKESQFEVTSTAA